MSRIEAEVPDLAGALSRADDEAQRRVAIAVSQLAWELRPIDDPRAEQARKELERGSFCNSKVRGPLEQLVRELEARQGRLREALDAGDEGVSDEEFERAFEQARVANALWFVLDDDPLTAVLEASYQVWAGFDEFETIEAFIRAALSGEVDPVRQAAKIRCERREAAEPEAQRKQFVGPDGTVPTLDHWAPDLVDALRDADPDFLRRTARGACELALERAPIEDARIEAAREALEAGPFGDSPVRSALRELVDELLAEEAELEGEWDARPFEEREHDPLIPPYRIEKGILVPGGTDEEFALEHARQAVERPALRRTATAYALWQGLGEDSLNATVGALSSIAGAFLNVDELETLVEQQGRR